MVNEDNTTTRKAQGEQPMAKGMVCEMPCRDSARNLLNRLADKHSQKADHLRILFGMLPLQLSPEQDNALHSILSERL